MIHSKRHILKYTGAVCGDNIGVIVKDLDEKKLERIFGLICIHKIVSVLHVVS